MKLTEKVKYFCKEYLIDCNGKQAAIRAGYAPTYADRQAYKLLHDKDVEEYIQSLMAEKDKELIASQDEVLKYLTTVLRGEEKDETVVFDTFGKAHKTEVRTQKNQLRAAELIGKRYGMFNDKVSLEGAIPVVISGEDKLED